jgi:hypothetical protein
MWERLEDALSKVAAVARAWWPASKSASAAATSAAGSHASPGTTTSPSGLCRTSSAGRLAPAPLLLRLPPPLALLELLELVVVVVGVWRAFGSKSRTSSL